MPNFRLSVSNTAHYTVDGKDLLNSKSIIDHTGEYLCEILLYNSGEFYRMGAILLKDYYSVYDVDNFRMGLGRVVDFDYVEPVDGPIIPSDDTDATDNNVDTDPEGGENVPQGRNHRSSNENLRDGLIYAGIAIIFIIAVCYAYKRRNDAEARNSGSQQARQYRKAYPVTEDDPNRSLILGQEEISNLKFIEGSDEEEEEECEEEEEELEEE